MIIKRALCAALALAFIFAATASPPIKTDALSAYGRAIERDVGFYKDPQAKELLFYLPYTYYVKIDEKSETISRAELFSGGYSTPAIDGYVYTADLYYEADAPVSPFFEKTLTTAAPAGLYADCEGKQLLRHIFENRTLKFYGCAYDADGNAVYFVDYNNELGYVKEECVFPFEIAPHPTPLPVTEEPEPTPPPEEPTAPEEGLGLKIAVIVSLVLAVAVILVFSVRPAKKKEEFYEESAYNDNEYR
ncbi:MAG: hypothetical protein DBX59_10665 [Bacillota bacterium]|nr:MAG: hypothetical protein DBX59_10665 [Bacillota bacterium]